MNIKNIPKWLNIEFDIDPISDEEFKKMAIIMKDLFESEEEWINWGLKEREKLKNERERVRNK